MNEIRLSGTIVESPGFHYDMAGNPQLSVRIEIEEPRVTEYGVERKKWKYGVPVTGQYAEELAEKLSPGDEVGITGKIHTTSWKSSGSQQWLQKVGILADGVKICGSETRNHQTK